MNSTERRELRYKRRCEHRAINRLIRNDGHDDFPTVFSYDNLYKSYRKCRRNVSWKASTQKFISLAPLAVYKIYSQLEAGKWKSVGFYEFDIFERGKARHIRSVIMDERVVQRCLCDNALVPILNKTLIYDNGASTKDKGYHFAINRCCKHLRDHYRKYGNDGYVLVFDFSKFFDSVSHELCEKIVKREFTDEKLINLIMYFVKAFGDVGLGLGSQISQTFALVCANRLDHYIKENLRIHGYGRYMDDGYLIHHDKEYLKHCLECINKICNELGITLNRKKTQIIKLSRGFTFLKCKIKLTSTGKIVKRIYKRSVTKMRRKLKKFVVMVNDGRMTIDDVKQAFQSWKAYAKHFNAWHTIGNAQKLYNELFPQQG